MVCEHELMIINSYHDMSPFIVLRVVKIDTNLARSIALGQRIREIFQLKRSLCMTCGKCSFPSARPVKHCCYILPSRYSRMRSIFKRRINEVK